MLSFTVLALSALASLGVAAPASRCAPRIPEGSIISFNSNLNTTLNLGTYDCEACHSLGLYPGVPIENEFSVYPGQTSSSREFYTLNFRQPIKREAYLTINRTPNYGSECITRAASGAVSPFERANCISGGSDVSQNLFSFECEDCSGKGTGSWGSNCQIRWTLSNHCLTTNGAPNVGGLTIEACKSSGASPGQLWTINAQK
ncbi:hypothetical protein RQP46_002653 [Phenoliferia psychrophenolica]